MSLGPAEIACFINALISILMHTLIDLHVLLCEKCRVFLRFCSVVKVADSVTSKFSGVFDTVPQKRLLKKSNIRTHVKKQGFIIDF